jgi:hypothetical protein
MSIQGEAGGSAQLKEAPASNHRAELCLDLRRLTRADGPRAANSASATIAGYDFVHDLTSKWLPLAQQRRDEAGESPADQARWDCLFKGLTPSEVRTTTSYEGLVVLTSTARELLRLLRDTEPPFVPIAHTARVIQQRISDGTYPIGMILSPGKIAAELAVPRTSVGLALDDLIQAKVVVKHAKSSAKVPETHQKNDRDRHLVEWLRELICAGAFPPVGELPPRREVARILVTATDFFPEAIRLPTKEDAHASAPGQRLQTGHNAPQPSSDSSYPDRPHAVDESWDLSPTGIREAVRRAHSWWWTGKTPSPVTFTHTTAELHAAAKHLLAQLHPLDIAPAEKPFAVTSAAARVRAMASLWYHPDFMQRLWRLACLATATCDLLLLIEKRQGSIQGNAQDQEDALPKSLSVQRAWPS